MKTIKTTDGLQIITDSWYNPDSPPNTVQLAATPQGGLYITEQTKGNLVAISSLETTGSGYTDGDILDVVSVTGTGAVLRVENTIDGGVNSATIINGGYGYDSTNQEVYTVTGGTGEGYTFKATVPTNGISVEGNNAYNHFGGNTNVDRLNDVIWPGPPSSANQVVTTDGLNNGSWVLPTLNFLDDVIIDTPTAGQTLVYDVSGKWLNQGSGEFYITYNASTNSPVVAYNFDTNYGTGACVTVSITAQAINSLGRKYSVVYYATLHGSVGLVLDDEVKTVITNDIDVGQTWDLYMTGGNLYVKNAESDSVATWYIKISVMTSAFLD